MSQSCGLPERFETKASVRPSGDQRGSVSCFSPFVSGRRFVPSASTSQMRAVRFAVARSRVRTT